MSKHDIHMVIKPDDINDEVRLCHHEACDNFMIITRESQFSLPQGWSIRGDLHYVACPAHTDCMPPHYCVCEAEE